MQGSDMVSRGDGWVPASRACWHACSAHKPPGSLAAKLVGRRDQQAWPALPMQEGDGAEGGEEPGFWVPEGVLQEHEMGEAEAEEAGEMDTEAGEEAAGGAPPAAQAAAGKAKAGKQKQAADRPAAAASSGSKTRSKQRQGSDNRSKQPEQAEVARNGSSSGSGKAKPPRAKKARVAS